MLDVFNCAMLTVTYGLHGKVDWRLGGMFGAVSALFAALVSNIMVNFLAEHQVRPLPAAKGSCGHPAWAKQAVRRPAVRHSRPQSFLKGIMYVVPFALSIGFCAKGIIVWRRRRRQQAAQVRGGAHGPALISPQHS